MESFLLILIRCLYAYLLTGLSFYLVFVWKGLKYIDRPASRSNVWFKLIILPGIVLLWPYLANKWRKSRSR